MSSSKSSEIPSKPGGDLSTLIAAWRLAAATYLRLARECRDTANRLQNYGSIFPAGELVPPSANGLLTAERTSEPAGSTFDDPGETRSAPHSLSPEPGLSPGPVCAEAGKILPTPQCSSGTTESRPFPATAAKVMESAGQQPQAGAAPDGGESQSQTCQGQDAAESPRAVCPDWHMEIDDEVCWCGEEEKYHHSIYCGHNFVPMGCECGRSKDSSNPVEGSIAAPDGQRNKRTAEDNIPASGTNFASGGAESRHATGAERTMGIGQPGLAPAVGSVVSTRSLAQAPVNWTERKLGRPGTEPADPATLRSGSDSQSRSSARPACDSISYKREIREASENPQLNREAAEPATGVTFSGASRRDSISPVPALAEAESFAQQIVSATELGDTSPTPAAGDSTSDELEPLARYLAEAGHIAVGLLDIMGLGLDEDDLINRGLLRRVAGPGALDDWLVPEGALLSLALRFRTPVDCAWNNYQERIASRRGDFS